VQNNQKIIQRRPAVFLESGKVNFVEFSGHGSEKHHARFVLIGEYLNKELFFQWLGLTRRTDKIHRQDWKNLAKHLLAGLIELKKQT